VARIPLVDVDDPAADPQAAALLTSVRDAQDVGILNVHRAMANHPEMMEKFFALAQVAYIDNSLNPVQRELAYYTSAVANNCFY